MAMDMKHDLDSRNEYLGGDPVFRDPVALNRLRQVVKRQWVANFGTKLPYTDYEADKIIAVMAPQSRENMIVNAVRGKRT